MANEQQNVLQVHLSTALVLMFAAGIMMWVNLQGTTQSPIISEGPREVVEIKKYGWPYTASQSVKFKTEIRANGAEIPHQYKRTYFPEIAADSLIALFVLFTVWRVCEWRIALKPGRNA